MAVIFSVNVLPVTMSYIQVFKHALIYISPRLSLPPAVPVQSDPAGEDGEAGRAHAGPPPEAGAAVRGLREAAHPEAERRGPEDGREALPVRLDRQATANQPRPPHPHQVSRSPTLCE